MLIQLSKRWKLSNICAGAFFVCIHLWVHKLDIFTSPISFQRTSRFFCFITMGKQQNGMSLSGPREPYMSVFQSRQNGRKRYPLHCWDLIWSSTCPISWTAWIFWPRWYAKRFLHPDIVAPYKYIFIWDEDLGVEHFDAEEWVQHTTLYMTMLNYLVSPC